MSSKDKQVSVTDLTAEDMFNDVNDFDEIAVEKAFGTSIYRLSEVNPFRWVRSLVFVHQRRAEGLSDAEALKVAREMPMRELEEYFAADDEMDPDNPETAAGEGDSQPN